MQAFSACGGGAKVLRRASTCDIICIRRIIRIILKGTKTIFSYSTWLSRRAAIIAYLPFSVHGRVSDIWRSYIMQYLLGHQQIGFRGAFVDHDRNRHSYMADMQAEKQLYGQAGALTACLQNRSGCFSCSDCACSGCSEQLSECYRSLLDDLCTRGFIEIGDVEVGSEWIQATGVSFE